MTGCEGGPVFAGDRIALLPAAHGVDAHDAAKNRSDGLSALGLDDVAVLPHAAIMHVASRSIKGEMHHASSYSECMETPADRLKAARIKAGYATAKSAAEAMGVTVSTYIQHESGVRGFPAGRAARYAKFFRVAPEWLVYNRGSSEPIPVEPTLTELPMVGPVQAGAWLAIDDTSQEEPPMMAAAADRRYPHARQWLREVRGDSMNARNIFPGDYVHIVELTGSGINLNSGMIVEVIRARDGGSLREITLKEVEIGERGEVILWPRSLNPRWSEPLILRAANDEADIEVMISGLLIAKITLF